MLTPEEIEEIEETLTQIMQGTDGSKLIYFNCDECCKVFEFPTDRPCEHIMKLFNLK
jgi:hypothetical protein